VRDNLRQALALFREAGYEVRSTKLVDSKTGEPFTFEFLVDDSATQRFVLFYKPSLERLGMNVNVRVVDAAQYENRLRQWDYDVIVAVGRQSLSRVTNSATSGVRRRQTGPARVISSASRIRPSMC
jgi:microcin C transport system substrate-binding protein